MSVNPPKHNLIQLIYRHLKEHGFHSAAEELQKQSPQDETNLPASLLDIYSSWLNDSKREKQPDPTKHSAFKKKRKSSIKASEEQTPTTPIRTQGKEDCGSHSEELSQSLLPQTPTASSKLYPPKTPIKTVTCSPDKPVKPGPLVQAAPGDSSDTTDISEEASKITPVRQHKSNNDAPDQNKTGTAKKQRAIKDQMPKMQAVTVTTPLIGKAKKKVDKPAKKEQDPKKSVPVKRRKTGENTTVTKKSKTSVKAAFAEREASDSDSSLDVEKWKKLILNMTETDVAKMDAINALESSAPHPKKKRENKPRTKPSAKTDVQPPQTDRASNDMDTVLVGDVTQTPAKTVKAKKNRAVKKASLSSSNTLNPNPDTVAIRPLSSTPSPSIETVEEENGNVAAHSEVKIDQKSKKKKKKKIKMNEEVDDENFSNAVENSIDNKEEKKKSEVPHKESCNSHVKKRNAKGNVDDGKEAIENVELTTESIVQQKKLKKKKNDEETLEQKTEVEINSEKMADEENIGQPKKAKKKKKKDKIDVDCAEMTRREEDMQTGAAETEDNAGEKNSEPISKEKKRKKKRKHHEENVEAVLEKNKFEEQKDQENVASASECTDEAAQPAEVNHKNKKVSSMKNHSVALSPPLSSHETPSERKKKKKSIEVQESPLVQDASASLQTPLSGKNKKKKKASGSIIVENL